MKKLKYIAYLLSFIAIGCTDLEEISYERIPVSEFPENPEQIISISMEPYTFLGEMIDDNGWWFLSQETSSDEITFPTRDSDWDDGGKWRIMHQHTWTDDIDGVNQMWRVIFEAVAASNQSVEALMAIEQTDAVIRTIKEVETLRSFYYYWLIDNYGDVPYVTEFAAAEENPEKDSRAFIFGELTSSVEAALPYLEAVDLKTQINRYSAFALLAKLYLNAEVYTGTAQWEKAGQYIDSLMAGPYVLNGNGDVNSSFAVQNEDNAENIFTIPFHEDNFQGFRIHMRSLHYQSNFTFDMNLGPWNGGTIMADHFDTYEDNDLRKSEWFLSGQQYTSGGDTIIEATTGLPLVLHPEIPLLLMTGATNTPEEIRTTGARIKKYDPTQAKENLSNDFPLFRLSDFYLMKAEVEIRMGRNGDEWVNPIRERAGLDPWSGTTLDQILAERGREVFAEGHRRQDLIRFGEFTKGWWAKGDDQGGVANDPSVNIFPVPKWAKDANPNL